RCENRSPGECRHAMGKGAGCESNHADQTDQAGQRPETSREVLVQHACSSGQSWRIGRAKTATLVSSGAYARHRPGHAAHLNEVTSLNVCKLLALGAQA